MCDNSNSLSLISTIGFEGKIPQGLNATSCGLVYAIGSNVVKGSINSGNQCFMVGHGNVVTCIDVDRSGKFIASGQQNHMGFKADVIIWDLSCGTIFGRHSIHSTRVNAVAFSFDGKYLMSVGNLDDHGGIAVWDTELCKCISGGKACVGRNGTPKAAAASSTRNNYWLVGGDDYLALWSLDKKTGRLTSERVSTKKNKRDILVIRIDKNDEFAYCGTTTGDIIKVKLNLPAENACCPPPGPNLNVPVFCSLLTRSPFKCEKGRNNHLYKGGVTALQLLENGQFLVGSGCGNVAQAHPKAVCRMGELVEVLVESESQICVKGQITSISVCGCDVYVGTTANEVYNAKLGCLGNRTLCSSAHCSNVNDIAFPHDFSAVFASCNYEDVRIWNADCMKELVRINVANMTCNAVIFTKDGRSIISGWSDSNIRTYTPQTGTPLWAIHHAHLRGVTTLAITSNSEKLVSGGEEGHVRVWALCPLQMTPIAIMKEHIGPISGMRMKCDDTEVATSSHDGSIIIWCLCKFVRKALVLQDTLFMDVAWYPDNFQVLGVTHNHKLGYYETYDGSTVREIQASETDPILSVDVSRDGRYVVTGGADRHVKIWCYQTGCLLQSACLHSAEVTRVRFSPCSDYILSCCQDGSIFKWNFPQ